MESKVEIFKDAAAIIREYEKLFKQRRQTLFATR